MIKNWIYSCKSKLGKAKLKGKLSATGFFRRDAEFGE